MTSLAEIWPPFGLQVSAGPVTLRVVTDDDLPALIDLIRAGVHDPQKQPFTYPWTDAPADEIAANTARHFWQVRSEFTPARWMLEFSVRLDGELVGCQGFSTTNYLVTRTGETGSWLARAHHGRGIGTLMRQAVCALLFDHLDAHEITSTAFTDNPASLGVSRKVGYQPDGVTRVQRRPGELAHLQQLRLTPESFVRGPDPVVVSGAGAVRAFLGLAD